ncbi:MAG: DUF2142 domain-containing protein, partial [Chloroflexota bacterium]
PDAVRHGRHDSRRLVPLLLCLSYGVLLLAWVWGNPPFASPDEWSHYVRAIGIGHGQLIGAPGHVAVPGSATAIIKREDAWFNQATRSVTVPAHLSDATLSGQPLSCDQFQPQISAACLAHVQLSTRPAGVVTPVGNYEPLGYILPGFLGRLGSNPFEVDHLGRLGAAAINFTLLAAALWLLWDGSMLSLAGLLLGVTPMSLFIASSINPSGLEISAGVAFSAALLRFWRERDPALWLCTAIGVLGLILCLSRTPSPLWAALDGLLLVGLLGIRELRGRVVRSPRGAALAAAGVAVGAGLNRLYEHAYGSHLYLTMHDFVQQLGPAVARLPDVVMEEVGVFGWLDTLLPPLFYRVWIGMVIALVIIALYLGTLRQRVMLILAICATIALPIVFSAVLTAATGFDVQGRDMLPFVVMLPLLAGEIVYRHRDAVPFKARVVGVTMLAEIVFAMQFVAWYLNGRRQSVGAGGPLWYPPVAQWSPSHLGWWPWLVAALGAVVLAMVTAYPWRRRA